jgi:hypothetical protein
VTFTSEEAEKITKVAAIPDRLMPGFSPMERVLIQAIKEFWERTGNAREN